MAGSYPDAPGRKMQVSEDGTLIMLSASTGGSPLRGVGALTLVSNANARTLGDHTLADGPYWKSLGGIDDAVIYIFPELRDIDGSYVNGKGANDVLGLLYSTDTTNGLDGTWTAQSTSILVFGHVGEVLPGYREEIYLWSQTAVRAVQWYAEETGLAETGIREAEFYGEISSGETPDRIILLDDNTGLEFAIPHDWGDRPRGTARDKLARLKNNSGSLTASTIDVDIDRVEAITVDATSWFEVDNGAGFAASFQVASLTSGSSDTFTLRQVIPDAAVPGLYEVFLRIAVGSWA